MLGLPIQSGRATTKRSGKRCSGGTRRTAGDGGGCFGAVLE